MKGILAILALPRLTARPGPCWLVAGLAACRDEEQA